MHIVFVDGRHNSALMGKPVRRLEIKCKNVFWLGGRHRGRETERERTGSLKKNGDRLINVTKIWEMELL